MNLRVLQVMEATFGGTRRHLVDLCTGLARRGVDVHLAVSCLRERRFEEDLARLEAQGCGVLRLPMVREIAPATDWAHLRALARHVGRLRPAIVHTHSSKAGALGRLASIQAGIGARVHTPHTFAFLFDAMFPAWKRALFRRVESALCARTERVIAVSPGEASTFERSGVVEPARVRVVPNGPDPAPWIAAAPATRASLGMAGEGPLAVVVGLLNVAKGQDLALEMLARPGLEALRLLVVGHGETRGALERRARELGLGERVGFLGFRDDVPAIVAAADFVLVPSRWEGMPYVALESMAAARAVVATPVDGARDVVAHGRTGILASAISVDALAEAARAMLARSPRERGEMGRLGRERMLAGFTAERMVEGVLGVYGEVA